MKPIVFISHSTKTDEAEAALDAMAARLDEIGFEIRLDRRDMRTGRQWRAELDTWMGECQAAVLLLSPQAIASPEVHAELFVLTHRKRRFGDDVLLLPVLIGGAAPDDLSSGEIARFELGRLHVTHWDPAGPLPDELRRDLEQVVALAPQDTPMAVLERKLAHRIDRSAIRDDTLIAAAEAMDLDLRLWPRGQARSLNFCRQLLAVPLEKQFAALAYEDIREVALDLFREVAPFGWIDGRAADHLRSCAVPPRAAAVNTRQGVTCRGYAMRAGLSELRTEIEAGFSEAAVEEVLDRAREALQVAHGWEPGEVVAAGELHQELAAQPTVLLVPQGLDPDLLDAIRREWPAVVLVLGCGDDTQDDFARRGLSDVEYVQPPVDRAREAEALALLARAERRWSPAA